jgi:hypothetical protein
MFKTCQYATNDDKNLMGLTLVSVKELKLIWKKQSLGQKH